MMLLRYFLYAFSPLGILLLCISLASMLGYVLLMALGDVLSIERMVNKGTQLFLVLSLFPLMSRLKLQWIDIGFNGKQLFFRQLLQGVFIGLLILGPIILLLYSLDVRVIKADKVWTLLVILKTLLGSMITALLISLIEEPIFRGLLLTAMRKYLGLVMGIMVSAAYYAILHFLKTDLDVPYAELRWYSAFPLIADALTNPFKIEHLQAFMALFAVGIFLALARLKAGMGLGFCIGCHTGWVFLIKITKSMSHLNVHSEYFFLVSHYDGVIGPLVTVWLFIAIASYLLYSRSKI